MRGELGGERRRERLLHRLREAKAPVPGAELAACFGVSRQVIVQDIAILRAAGAPILATSRGYLVPEVEAPPRLRAVLALRHTPEQTLDELYLMVDHGLRVVDVIVDHPLYGELRGTLMLETRADVSAWWSAVVASGARLLSELTAGVHLHTVEARDEATLDGARVALRGRGYLVEATVRMASAAPASQALAHGGGSDAGSIGNHSPT